MATATSNLSLVPGQIPASLIQQVIDTSGTNGRSGGYGGTPSSGTSAADIVVDLYYDRRRPSNIQVINTGYNSTEVSPAEDLHLRACGGHGGNGGSGTVC
jgi:hypothetical protein